MKNYITLFFIICFSILQAQEYVPKNDGVKAQSSTTVAFINANLYVTPTNVIPNGTLLIKDDKIVSSGANISIPEGTHVIDLNGKSVYPSFIDLYSSFGIDKPKRGEQSRTPQYDSNRDGYYWNDHIIPSQNANDKLNYNDKEASELLAVGFGVVNTHIPDGIIRGTSSLYTLNNHSGYAKRVIAAKAAQHLSLDKSVTSQQIYPTSVMGSLALIRQVNHDANWYAKKNIEQKDWSLEAFNKNRALPQIFEVSSKLNSLRVDKLGDEFNTQYIIMAAGDEYEIIDAVKATNAQFILPLHFPDAYNAENANLISTVELEAMREWNQRPAGPKLFADNNIVFALSTHQLKSPNEFKTNLLKAIKYGLDKTKALEALTTNPAQMIGWSSQIGTLDSGKLANFFIANGDVFEKDTEILEHWTLGQKHSFKPLNAIDIRGEYTLTINGQTYKLSVTGEADKPSAKTTQNGTSFGTKLDLANQWLNIVLTNADNGFYRLTAYVTNPAYINGKVILPNGQESTFTAKQTEAFNADKPENDENSKKENEKDDDDEPVTIFPITYPNTAYGFETKPKQQTILIKNATVWTNEADGILKNTDVLLENGKIAKIGTNLNSNQAQIIDGSGKHLTAGIIDEHSHIAADAINEAGHNSSAEVSIAEVINPEDIDIYRNLAGGVTTIQILHGSANPIGGQSAIIKLKWGEDAEAFKVKEAPKFIKFALGENVKQSNWGSTETIRFPQTRMGVEQVFIDYFIRAKAYDAKKKSGQDYRIDNELEVISEILNGERFISCHSYVQSEINMLMKVAEQFNFRINTFTHILEGYKLADKMKAHGVAGSTFSDWWGYKFEVNDAIPYNGAIMHNAGVLTAFNSDDAEMSRRLNQEAAKAVKYGNVPEEEAWKFVTLNPAKMLHLDKRIGSIKEGKDADVVLWSGHPMAVYTKAEKTIIEGVVRFDIERDKAMRKAIQKEKAQLINLMLKAKNKGLKTQEIAKKDPKEFHCDTL